MRTPLFISFHSAFIASLKGGHGSGNFGHSGRHGKVGGSIPSRQAQTARRGEWAASLSPQEKDALYHWGRSDMVNLIRRVQAGEDPERLEAKGWSMQEIFRATRDAIFLQKALSRCPRFQGTVYRGLKDVPSQTIERWVKSGEVSLNNDQSASKDFRTAAEFSGGIMGAGAVMFRLKQKSGYDIGEETGVMKFSSGADDYLLADEQEVILPKSARYKITGILVYPPSFKGGQYAGTKKKGIPFYQYAARKIAEEESRMALNALYKKSGARILSKYNQYSPLEWTNPDRADPEQRKKAYRWASEIYYRRRKQLEAEFKAGDWHRAKRWPAVIDKVLIDLEEV